jgi:hypothetical protein
MKNGRGITPEFLDDLAAPLLMMFNAVSDVLVLLNEAFNQMSLSFLI